MVPHPNISSKFFLFCGCRIILGLICMWCSHFACSRFAYSHLYIVRHHGLIIPTPHHFAYFERFDWLEKAFYILINSKIRNLGIFTSSTGRYKFDYCTWLTHHLKWPSSECSPIKYQIYLVGLELVNQVSGYCGWVGDLERDTGVRLHYNGRIEVPVTTRHMLHHELYLRLRCKRNH